MYRALVITIFSLIILVGKDAMAQKTDKILLQNNDWLTGELKKMDYAKATFKTDAASTIQIKWDHILQIKSDKFFEIDLNDGSKYFGSIDATEDDQKYTLVIVKDESRLPIDMNQIVEMTQIKNRFWTRLDGNIDLGYSYTKGSEVKQWNGSFRLDYRSTKSLSTIAGNSIFTEQPERVPTSKQDFSLSFKRFMLHQWAYNSFGALQQNTELGIKLRSSFGLGLSRNWLRSNTQRIISTAGIIVNREVGENNTGKTTNYEALLRTEYRVFRYSDPEIDITSSFDLYPSLSIKERIRSDLNLKVRFEVFDDFYIGLTLYHNFDSKPPEAAVSTSDWGVTTSIGYSF